MSGGIVDLYCAVSSLCVIGGFRSGFAFDLKFEFRILNLLDLIEVRIDELRINLKFHALGDFDLNLSMFRFGPFGCVQLELDFLGIGIEIVFGLGLFVSRYSDEFCCGL